MLINLILLDKVLQWPKGDGANMCEVKPRPLLTTHIKSKYVYLFDWMIDNNAQPKP